MALIFSLFSKTAGKKCRRSLESPLLWAWFVLQQRTREHLSCLFFPSLPTPPPSVPFFHFMRSGNIHTPLIATAQRRRPPRLAVGFFFPWIFASHHADGPLALPDGSAFPPPPPAVLLFHSKMASALEPLVCGCIFGLVVVSVSHGFGTFSAAARLEIPVSSSGSRMGRTSDFCFARSSFRELPSETRTGPARASRGTARGRGERGVRRDDGRGGGWLEGGGGGGLA